MHALCQMGQMSKNPHRFCGKSSSIFSPFKRQNRTNDERYDFHFFTPHIVLVFFLYSARKNGMKHDREWSKLAHNRISTCTGASVHFDLACQSKRAKQFQIVLIFFHLCASFIFPYETHFST